MRLYEATAALRISEEWLEESGGELTPEVEELLAQAEGDFATKVERVALKVKELEVEAAAIGEEAERLAARAKARAKGAISLKAYLHRQLDEAGRDRVNGTLVTVTLQSNPPSVREALTADELRELFEAGASCVREIPATFVLDKKEVLAAAKRAEADGRAYSEVLPAHVEIVRTTSLRIR